MFEFLDIYLFFHSVFVGALDSAITLWLWHALPPLLEAWSDQPGADVSPRGAARRTDADFVPVADFTVADGARAAQTHVRCRLCGRFPEDCRHVSGCSEADEPSHRGVTAP